MKILIKIIIFLLCIFLITHHFRIHQNELEYIKYISWISYLKITGLLTLILIFYSIKSLLILKSCGLNDIKFMTWFKIFNISRFINFHITQGSNLYRAFILKKNFNFSYTNAISLISAAGWLDIIAILSFALLILQIPTVNSIVYSQKLLLAILLGMTICPIVINIVLKKASHLKNFHNKLFNLVSNTLKIFTNVKLIISYLALNYLWLLLYLFTVKICFSAINITITSGQLIIFTTTLLLSRVINILPGNIGLAELLCGVTTAKMGIDTGSGIIVSSIFRIINYGTSATLSLFYFPEIIKNFFYLTKNK